MDVSCIKIAKLVLGYLKAEKCHSAHAEFLRSCCHLRHINKSGKKSIATTILGKTLFDIIDEYSKIFSIVQERLEFTDFFNVTEHSLKLNDQLIYLLDHANALGSPSLMSRCSTPITARCHCDSHSMSDVNATPLNSLPGHSSTGTGSPKQRSSTGQCRLSGGVQREFEAEADGSKDDSDSFKERNESAHMVVQAFATSLLQQQDLQEKIAESINKVRHLEVTERPEDIDEAIKTVIARTESDPAFDSLIVDIIGSMTGDDERDDIEDEACGKEDVAHVEDKASQPDALVEEQNNDAINSLISTVQKMDDIPTCDNFPAQIPSIVPPDINKKLSINTNSGDIILYDGSFDSYLRNGSGSATTPITQPMVINQPGLLMMKPQQNQCLPGGNVDPMKPFYVINAPQLVNVPPQPQPQYVINKVLSEQDIIAMPTVIVCDNSVNQNIVPENVCNTSAASTMNTLLPKVNEKHETLTDYITLYKCDESDDDIAVKSAVTAKSTKKLAHPKLSRKIPMTKVEIKITEPLPTPKESENSQLINGGVANLEINGKTPEDKITAQKPSRTPKSSNRSHIRALDFKFHTPPKEALTMTSSINTNVKTASTKSKSAKSLFKSPSKQMKKVEVTKPKSWDAELRALASSGPVINRVTPLRQRIRKPPIKGKSIAKKITPPVPIKVIDDSEDDRPSKRTRSKGKLLDKSLTEVLKSDEVADSSSKKIEVQSCHGDKVDDVIDKTDDSSACVQPESQITLRNCNKKAGYKKKCNMDKPNMDVLTGRDMKTIELAVILTDEEVILAPKSDNTIEAEETDNPSTFHTPDFVKPKVQQPVSVKKNIIPSLETPIKENFVKTPGYFSPVSTYDTPNTKLFNEQMQGIDISSIPTPKFPITPNFPLTPFIESPCSNRPTDYSTSSSYYQPSDSEQNKSLEMVIRKECNRLENKKITDDEPTEDLPGDRLVIDEKYCDKSDEDHTHKAIAEKMKQLHSNVIGRKNLNLIKDGESSSEKSSSEESSTSYTSSATGSGSDESSEDDSDGTTKSMSPRNISKYSLRSKQTKKKKELSEPPHSDEGTIKNIIQATDFKPQLTQLDRKIPKVITSDKAKVLKDMEEKKKRTLAKLKSETSSPAVTKTESKSAKQAKPKLTAKPKPGAKVATKKRPVNLAMLTSKRTPRAKNTKQLVSEDFAISSSDNEIEPLEIVETELLCSSNSTTPSPPLEPPMKQPTSFQNVFTSIHENVAKLQANAVTVTEIKSGQKIELKAKELKAKAESEIKTKFAPKTKTISGTKAELEAGTSGQRDDILLGLEKMGIHLMRNPTSNTSESKNGKGDNRNSINNKDEMRNENSDSATSVDDIKKGANTSNVSKAETSEKPCNQNLVLPSSPSKEHKHGFKTNKSEINDLHKIEAVNSCIAAKDSLKSDSSNEQVLKSCDLESSKVLEEGELESDEEECEPRQQLVQSDQPFLQSQKQLLSKPISLGQQLHPAQKHNEEGELESDEEENKPRQQLMQSHQPLVQSQKQLVQSKPAVFTRRQHLNPAPKLVGQARSRLPSEPRNSSSDGRCNYSETIKHHKAGSKSTNIKYPQERGKSRDTKNSESHGKLRDTKNSESYGKLRNTKNSESQGNSRGTKNSASYGKLRDTKSSESHDRLRDTKSSESHGKLRDTKNSESHGKLRDSINSESHGKPRDTKYSEPHTKFNPDYYNCNNVHSLERSIKEPIKVESITKNQMECKIDTATSQICLPNVVDLKFDVKTIDTETLALVYNEENPTHRTITCDVDMLSKTFKTTVFTEEDKDVDINMTVTAFECLIDIPSKLETYQKQTINILEDMMITKSSKGKPLQTLYNKLNPATDQSKQTIDTKSPLDDLYSKEVTSYGPEKSAGNGKHSKLMRDVGAEFVRTNYDTKRPGMSRRESREAAYKKNCDVISAYLDPEQIVFGNCLENRTTNSEAETSNIKNDPKNIASGKRKRVPSKIKPETYHESSGSNPDPIDLRSNINSAAKDIPLATTHSNQPKPKKKTSETCGTFTSNELLDVLDGTASSEIPDACYGNTNETKSVASKTQFKSDSTSRSVTQENCDLSNAKHKPEIVGLAQDSPVLDCEPVENLPTSATEEEGIGDQDDDDLMNYTLTLKSAQDKSGVKRSADEENDPDPKRNKNDNCKELLKKVDVDVFLSQLHGA